MNQALPHRSSAHRPRRTKPTASRQQARTDATRRKLLVAAERSLRATDLRPPAWKISPPLAGYTRGAFYANFESKEDIFFALLEHWVGRRISEVDANCSPGEESPAKLLRALREHYAQITQDRRLALAFARIQAFRHPPSRSARATARAPAASSRFRRRSAAPHRQNDGRARFRFRAPPPPPDSARFRAPFRSNISSITRWCPTRISATCSEFSSTLSLADQTPTRLNSAAAIARPVAKSAAALVRFQILWHSRQPMAASGKPNLSGRVAFTYPAFMLYQLARFCIVLATEMQAVAIGWQVYEITKRPLDLGLVGLSQFLPGILLFLVSGYTADRFDRRRVLTVGYAAFAMCSGCCSQFRFTALTPLIRIYAVVVLVGIVRSFNAPASRAILPLLGARGTFSAARSRGARRFSRPRRFWGRRSAASFTRSFAGRGTVYTAAMIAAAAAAISMLGVKPQFRPRPRESFSWRTVLAGMHYIWREKLVLGSISLDMFAVLLGGAVAGCCRCSRATF